jgi:hypothetical protein
MLKERDFRDRCLGITLVNVLVISKVFSRGIRPTNGIVVNFLHVISFYNVLLISRRMAINALNSRMGTRISDRVPLTTPQ